MTQPAALAHPPEALEALARRLRAEMVRFSHHAGVPHLGSCLSCADILVALYFHVLRLNPQDATDPDRDRFILSKGHGAPALYQILAARGFFSSEDLYKPNHGGGLFGEHPPTPDHMPGIEAATGSLGHGLSMAVGMALATRLQGRDAGIYVVLGDGECNEGSVWEAAMFAAAQQLGRLTVIIDFNKWQATGRSAEVLALTPLADKWRAFGWHATEVDGHDMPALLGCLGDRRNDWDRPRAIIAHTVKGRGVSFMEDDNNWHYRIPKADEVAAAARELGVA